MGICANMLQNDGSGTRSGSRKEEQLLKDDRARSFVFVNNIVSGQSQGFDFNTRESWRRGRFVRIYTCSEVRRPLGPI